jgi:ABC-2 type transport system permease protein/lipopolysaccharide transport system permease protein
MTDADLPLMPSGPPPELRYRRRTRLLPSLREAWRSRELVLTLTQRDFLVRYKQAVLGVAWALITPVILVVIFSLLFNRVAHVDTNGAPYVLFAYLGLLPWTFFSSSLSQSATCLLNNRPLLNKVRFPREVMPAATVVVAGIDTAIASIVLAVLFVVYQQVPAATSVWVPVLFAIQLAFTLAVALTASIVVVFLRDLNLVVPVLLQFGLFATPVAYGLDAVPSWFLPIYAALNPLGPVIQGYRDTILDGKWPDLTTTSIAAVSATIMLVGAYALFKRLEPGIADVA